MKKVNKSDEPIFVYHFDERETTRLDEVFQWLFEQAEQVVRAEPCEPTV